MGKKNVMPFKAKSILVSTLSPANSNSDYAILMNTLSPANSASPEILYGRFKFNTLSPPASASPVNITYRSEGKTKSIDGVEFPGKNIKVIDKAFLAKKENLTAIYGQFLDSFLVSLLTPNDLVKLEAGKLFFLKMELINEMANSGVVKKELRNAIRKTAKKIK